MPRLSIRSVLILLLVAQTTAVATVVAGLSIWHGNQAVDEMALRLADELGDRIEAHIDQLLAVPPLLNELNADAIQAGHVDPYGPTGPLEELFYRHLKRFPVSLTYIGTERGDYIGARRLDSGDFTISLVNAFTDFRNERFATDAEGNRTKLLLRSVKVYDARKRPWYSAAVQRDGPAWTDIYTDYSSGALGITASRPVKSRTGEVTGVLATDLMLVDLDRFLESLRIGKTGWAYIIEPNGLLVGSSMGAPLMKGPKGEVERIQASESGDVRISHVAIALGEVQRPRAERIVVGGEDHYVLVDPYEDALGLKLVSVVVVPRADFMDHIDAHLRWTVLVSGIAIGVSMFFGALFTGWITRPLARLSHEMDEIEHLVLLPPSAANSSLTEIAVIEHSLESMKRGLRSFEKYVPADVVRSLIRNHEEAVLGVDVREVTLFFSDVAGFTTVAETLGHDDLVHVLESLLGEMSAIVMDHRGTVDKYIGDAIMAFWNAPDPVPDHPSVACGVALDCQAKLAELRKDWKDRGLPELHVRIGLHVGEALVGNLGWEQRMDYTAIGDTVNVAARLEGLNKRYGTEILISAQVASRVVEHFLLRHIDRVAVKGRAGTTEIYELVARRETATDAQKALVDDFEQAIDSYQKRDFAGAVILLTRMLDDHPDDAPTKALLARCEAFQREPPPEDWNGVWVATTK